MAEILITGSRGFIGTAVRNVINYPYDEIDLKLGTDHRDVKGRVGTLLFLSSWVKPNESVVLPTKYLENNLTALSQLIINNSFDKIIFPSSHTVYDKDGNLEPVSVYGLTKLAGEKLIRMYCKNCWILRLGNPYGENDTRSMFYDLAKCKLEKKKFPIYSNDVSRDYFPVTHIANIINNIFDGKIQSGIHNVGTGKMTIVSHFIKKICEKYEIEYEVVDSQEWVADSYIPTTNLLKTEVEDLEEEWRKYYLK